jgi:hypothetical protein
MRGIDKAVLIKYKQIYRSICFAKCPAFSGESIFFGRSGFNHLLRKGRKLRQITQQIDRLKLLSFATYIISTSISYDSHRTVKDKKNPEKWIKFWSLVCYGLFDRKITVIVRQSGHRRKEFYSIFM